MEDDTFADIVYGLVEGRNHFFSRTINQFRPPARDSIMMRYMMNEISFLELTNRVLQNSIRATQNTASLVFNLPSNFLDPVPVAPTQAQIAAATETLTQPTGETQCAICQDNITVDATRIRACTHVYHRSCIMNWLTMSSRCPVCRHDIRSAHPPAQTSSASAETSPPPAAQ